MGGIGSATDNRSSKSRDQVTNGFRECEDVSTFKNLLKVSSTFFMKLLAYFAIFLFFFFVALTGTLGSILGSLNSFEMSVCSPTQCPLVASSNISRFIYGEGGYSRL